MLYPNELRARSGHLIRKRTAEINIFLTTLAGLC